LRLRLVEAMGGSGGSGCDGFGSTTVGNPGNCDGVGDGIEPNDKIGRIGTLISLQSRYIGRYQLVGVSDLYLRVYSVV